MKTTLKVMNLFLLLGIAFGLFSCSGKSEGITLENGVQSEILAKVGDIKTGLEKGVTGEISPASDFGEIIGTFKIVSVTNGFVTCRIESVTKKIPNNAFIRVQIGQKEKEE